MRRCLKPPTGRCDVQREGVARSRERRQRSLVGALRAADDQMLPVLEADLRAESAVPRHLPDDAAESSATKVLHPVEETLSRGLEARMDERLLHDRRRRLRALPE